MIELWIEPRGDWTLNPPQADEYFYCPLCGSNMVFTKGCFVCPFCKVQLIKENNEYKAYFPLGVFI